MKKRHVIFLLFFLLSGVFVFSRIRTFTLYRNSLREREFNESLKESISSVDIREPRTPEDVYGRLFDRNRDMAGWIRIDGTSIDYPVMFTPYAPEKYLRLNFDGKYALGGTPFVGSPCDMYPRTDNVTIYGHNMTDGSMFHDLEKYKDSSFLESNSVIAFDTLEEFRKYKIVYVFVTQVYTESDFKFYDVYDFPSETSFEAFRNECDARAYLKTRDELEYGDELLTLATCEYSREGGRIVVIAKKISSSGLTY